MDDINEKHTSLADVLVAATEEVVILELAIINKNKELIEFARQNKIHKEARARQASTILGAREGARLLRDEIDKNKEEISGLRKVIDEKVSESAYGRFDKRNQALYDVVSKQGKEIHDLNNTVSILRGLAGANVSHVKGTKNG